jgi:DNA (cytosine-5)-methyltransferase 1
MVKRIPVIDLFAGPGGLAEGFSSLVNQFERRFDIKLSIEMDPHARQTLKLRSFLRNFPFQSFPPEYYLFLKGELTLESLYKSYPEQHLKAENEAWMATLGKTPIGEIDDKITKALDGAKEWVLIGGPPCQAYSMAGRSRVGGIKDGDHRVLLYREYLRIIAAHQPSVFVMENVKGLLSAKVGDDKIFDNILADLKDPSSIFPEYKSLGYNVYSLVEEIVKKDADYLIKSERYGVPQRRHRVILLGVREDINKIPSQLLPQSAVSLKTIIDDLPPVRSSVYREHSSTEEIWVNGILKKRRSYKPLEDSYCLWEKTILKYRTELSALLPDDEEFFNGLPQSRGSAWQSKPKSMDQAHPLKDWYSDNRLTGIINHESRGHLTNDLKRYLFSTLFTKKFSRFPRIDEYKTYGRDLVPDHSNVESGKFNDRFRVQLPEEVATTVTSHISKDGHYFIHYDPLQCRSLTVREAARIQTFPDNYFFCGSRTQQFHQVGNAVPPFLAFQISKVVSKLMHS